MTDPTDEPKNPIVNADHNSNAGSIISTRDHIFSIGAEGDRDYKTIMYHTGDFFACACLPYVSGIIPIRDHIVPVGAEGT